MKPRTARLAAATLLSLLVVAVGCGDSTGDGSGDDGSSPAGPDLFCRDNPLDCQGEIGGSCDADDACLDGTCCEDKNCGGGMCTYRCDGDRDCPDGMLCEHDFCFFTCRRDSDCGEGQKCEHGSTICEYEGGN